MGRAAGHLSAEAMLKLLDLRNRPEAMVGSVDVTRAVIDRMDDQSLSISSPARSSRSGGDRAARACVPGAGAGRAAPAPAARAGAGRSGTEAAGEGFDALWNASKEC